MRNFVIPLLTLSVLCVCCASSGVSKPIKIAVISDIHYLDAKLVSQGEALSSYQEATGRNIADLHAVLDVVFDDLHKEAPDLLLVTGDITNNGEKQSHLGFIDKLNSLQKIGTRVFVIPGNHDINIPDAKAYRGGKSAPVETISKKEFEELYAPFGYSDALKRDEASLSYLARINESVWLLCFDTNRYEAHTKSTIADGRILPETMEWARNILGQAREQGILVLGMMHHGLVEHMPYQATFFSQYLVDDWERDADILADAGLKVVFTGHFHANDVAMRTSPAGNDIYDVETASLAQYPFAYRITELTDERLFIDTRFVDTLAGSPDLAAAYHDKLENITRRVAVNWLGELGSSMPREASDAFVEVIVKLNLMHVKGDEKPDRELETALRRFADQMGSDADMESFSLDFPPADNRLVIPLR